MTNYESVEPDKVKEIFASFFAINKNTLEINTCLKTNCVDCLFYNESCDENCEKKRKKWLDQPVIDWNKDIDWEKVPVDTPVIVWSSDNCSYNRYFSGIKDGRFSAYSDGRTSWSSITDNICYWNHCKLYRLEDVEKYRKKETENG